MLTFETDNIRFSSIQNFLIFDLIVRHVLYHFQSMSELDLMNRIEINKSPKKNLAVKSSNNRIQEYFCQLEKTRK